MATGEVPQTFDAQTPTIEESMATGDCEVPQPNVPIKEETAAYLWSEGERNLIQIHRQYYTEMLAMLNGLEQHKPRYM